MFTRPPASHRLVRGCGRDVRELGGKENCRGIQGSAEDRKQGFTEATATAPLVTPGPSRRPQDSATLIRDPRNPQGMQPARGRGWDQERPTVSGSPVPGRTLR